MRVTMSLLIVATLSACATQLPLPPAPPPVCPEVPASFLEPTPAPPINLLIYGDAKDYNFAVLSRLGTCNGDKNAIKERLDK